VKINGRDVDVRRFTWAEPGGEMHVDIIKLMNELGIPWSAENERSVTQDVINAFRTLSPGTPVHHLVDRKPPAKPRGN